MKQYLLGYFKTYLLLKKTCGDFGVLCMTRLLDIFAGVLIIIIIIINLFLYSAVSILSSKRFT